MQPIKNIIFDLGGVIINLDMAATARKFEALGAAQFSDIYTQLHQTTLFDRFETGQITPADFRAKLQLLTGLSIKDSEFDDAWNAMLLDFPKQRLDLLQSIKPLYRTFLLSNTNVIHVEAFETILLNNHGHRDLSAFFENIYYSCELGMRKPDREIFEKVLQDNALDPKETIFIDDSLQHVEGAQKAGILAFPLGKQEEVADLLKRLKLI